MAGENYNPLSGMKPTAPKNTTVKATPAQVKTFTTGVDKAQADFNKSLEDAKSTLAQANKQGNKVVAASAKALIDQLNTVVKPALAILQKAENPNQAYTGDITGINKALGSGPAGSGPSGIVLGSGGKGKYSLSQIREYMDANNGAFPPDLNTIASGISASDLSTLINQYESGTPLDKKSSLDSNNPKTSEIDKGTRDAYALLEEAFKLYGLESLVPVIRGYMEQDLGPEQAKLKLKSEKVYKDRFKGNELRVAKGLNVVSEAEYLELENDYSETLKAYGLSDYFGVSTDANTRLARQQKMAEVIGNDISATEFKDRIDTVVTRVNMSDPNIKTELKRLYAITDTDLVKYFLNPVEGSEQLKQKVTAAEISGASITQGLGQTSLGTAEELARLGIDRAEALAGYSKIAQYLPTTEKLSSIYASEGITYNKATGEEEEFKGLASAKRKRQTLASRELGTFSGSSGTSQSSLKTKTAGQI
jgi:hypothetical protein